MLLNDPRLKNDRRNTMREHTQSRIRILLLLGLIILVFYTPSYAYAESLEHSEGYNKSISMLTTVPPRVVSGRGGSHEKGGLSSLSFITDDVKKNLVKVLVDGKEIDSKKYTVSGNPLTVTLNANYLNTLASEGHVIEIVTVNGTANANFTITDENQQNPSNYMDDSDNTNSIVNDQTTPVTPADNFDHNADQNNNTNNTERNDRTTDNPDESKPFIEGHPEQNGWDVIKDKLLDAISDKLSDPNSDGKVIVDMNGASVVPGDVVDEIRGQDVTVVFDLGEGVKWTINGMDITGDNIGDIDFGVKIGTNTIPVDVVNNITGEKYSIQISLAHNGDFGFSATLSVDMDKKNAGLFANLFYYNTDTEELEFICADEIASDGTAELTFTHASDYTIVVDTEPMDGSLTQANVLANAAGADNTVTGFDTQGRTTDSAVEDQSVDEGAWSLWWIIIICGVVIAIGLGGFYVIRKKRQ